MSRTSLRSQPRTCTTLAAVIAPTWSGEVQSGRKERRQRCQGERLVAQRLAPNATPMTVERAFRRNQRDSESAFQHLEPLFSQALGRTQPCIKWNRAREGLKISMARALFSMALRRF